MIRDIKIGDIIGPLFYEEDLNFEVYDIFKGGMGVVYAGLIAKHGAIIALKTFQDRFINSDIDNDRFQQESLAWIKLEIHPNIVYALTFDVVDRRPFICLEFVAPDENNRNTLEDYLRTNLSNSQIIDWAIQFCYGMSHAFSRGVSPHRDIKPTNIMITQEKLVKITDFGLANVWDPDLIFKEDSSTKEITALKGTDNEILSGTPPWMAPENFSGYADIKSDIYSFGIVLYQMINNGKLPFEAESLDGWKQVHQNNKIPQMDSILFSIVEKCTEKDPENRYNDFNELKKDLEALYIEETGKRPYKPTKLIHPSKGFYFRKGYGFEKLGMTDEALRIYADVKKMDSESYLDMINLGAAFNRLNQPKNAIKEYKRAVELNPNHPLGHYNLGNAYNYNGQIKEAIDEYEDALRLNPDYKECHTNYGNLLRNIGNLDEAINHYNIVLDSDSDFFKAKVNLGIALMFKEEYVAALKLFQDAEKIKPESTEVLINWGFLLSLIGDYYGAISKYAKALSLDPESSEAHDKMGLLFLNKGNLNRAVHEFKEAIRTEPANYVAHQHLGRSLQRMGNINEALESYNNSISIKSDYDVAWHEKGTTLAQQGHLDEALECFEETLKLNPGNALSWINKGSVYGLNIKHKEALECFDRAIEIDPDLAEAWYHKGLAISQLKNKKWVDETFRCFNQAIKIEPMFAQAYFQKSLLCGLLENVDDALVFVNKALEIDQNNVKYLNYKAAALFFQNKNDEATKCIEKAKKIDPGWKFEL
ncbi:MAG: tetratricopeptide repeat protein [Methanobacterium formicicum]